ncbi:MAG: OmpA family protein [Bacteroidia bacterium]|nr:OmpA family protein [Bacteroidia bacterium]
MNNYFALRWVVVWFLGLVFLQTNGQTLWQKCVGGTAYETAFCFENTHDGCYLVGATTRSGDGDLAGRTSLDAAIWVQKINAKGNVIWSQILGGKGTDEIRALKVTRDGGSIIVGFSDSKDTFVPENKGKRDAYIIRLDALGNTKWAKTYGGSGNDIANAVLQLEDGGFIIGGETGSRDGDVKANKGGIDFWIFRLDKNGTLIWETTFGGVANESVSALTLTKDGNLLAAGVTDSGPNDGDVTYNNGKTDIFLAKISLTNQLIWKRFIGGNSNEELHGVVTKPDGGFMLAATTFSNAEPIKSPKGGGDIWIVSTDPNGEIEWEKTYGGSGDEGANSISATYDGNYLISGTTRSKNGDITTSKGLYDAWLFKIKPTGEFIWKQTFGGSENESFYAGYEIPSGDYVVVGMTESTNGDLTNVQKQGGGDVWVLCYRDPISPPQAISLTPTSLIGYVKDKKTKKYIYAEVALVDNRKGTKLSSTVTDTTFGIYQIILPDTNQMSISFFSPGYMFYGKNVYITDEERYAEIRLDVELEPIGIGAKLDLYNIFFDTGKADIRPESKPELDRILNFLNKNPKLRVQINGHTDDTGAPQTKMQLSLMRANAIRNYLIAAGITPNRLSTKGFGMTKPIASNIDEVGRQLNRRVEFEVTALF